MSLNTSLIKLSIVIPVYNAEKTICRLVGELIGTLASSYALEIILVNDHSQDHSERVCVDLFRKHPNTVRFYSLSKNVGEHNAVMAGLNQATGDYIVIMDDDFQNPVPEVLRLVQKAQANDFDVVYSCYEKKEHSLFRNFGSWLNDYVATWMLQKPRDLYLSSFKVLNKFLVKEIIKYHAPFPYIDGLILQITDNIGKVKVEHNKRLEGRSGYTFRKLIRLWLNMFTNFSVLPLRAAILLGFMFSCLGIIFGIYTVLEKIRHPLLPLGYASLVTAISVFVGIQLLVIGMVGEYVGRIFLSINKKPQFTIKRKYESNEQGRL